MYTYILKIFALLFFCTLINSNGQQYGKVNEEKGIIPANDGEFWTLVTIGAVVDVAIIIIVILDYSKGMFSGFKL